MRRKTHPVSTGKANLEKPVQSPPTFVDESLNKRAVSTLSRQRFGEREHCVRRLAGIDGTLRKIARVVPPSVHRDPLVAERGEPVAVIVVVDARNLDATSLAVEKVERLPDRSVPDIVIDAERLGANATGFDNVGAGLANLREVEFLKCPAR